MFWQRFYDLCVEKGSKPNPIAKSLGFSSSTVTQWKNGAVPSAKSVEKIAEYFGVSTDYLLGRKQPNEAKGVIPQSEIRDVLPQSKVRMIPLYESVSAGLGAYASSSILRYEPVYIESDYDAENALCIIVKGDSMQPIIEDGDTILVIKDLDFENGDIVVAMTDDETGYVKKIYDYPQKTILRSLNPTYEDMVFLNEEKNGLKIIGVVKSCIKRF